jgi:cytochrome c oxidase subunit I+III
MTTTPLPERPSIDAGKLPDVAFGHRDLVWWGTMGFVVIEALTLAVAATVWIYLRQNMPDWPPHGTLRPFLGLPSLHVALMLLSLPVVYWMGRAAARFDHGRTRVGATVLALFVTAFAILRWFELTQSLNVRWDTNAYGSAQWLVVGLHGTLIAMQLVEMWGIAVAFWLADLEKKHFSDAADATFYWTFLVLSWLPLYVLCFVLTQRS